MENGGDESSVEKVFSDEELVESIVQRVGYSLSMLWCRLVSPTFATATRTDSFARSFCERSVKADVGYVVEFERRAGKLNKLLYHVPDEAHETRDFIRSKVNHGLLLREDVLAVEEGLVLTTGAAGGANGGFYHTSCLFSRARKYKQVARLMDKIPVNQQRTVNTLGQFGVLPNAGVRGNAISFFIQDPARNFLSCHEGVSFCSDAGIYVHVNVYNGNSWDREVFGPIQSPRSTALFHRAPYSIIDGNNLLMMYLVDFIISMDLVTKEFVGLALPDNVGQKLSSSWYDYTVAPRSGGGLVLVNYKEGCILQKWELSTTGVGGEWENTQVVSLMTVFENIIPFPAWSAVLFREAYPIAFGNEYTVHVRKASKDADLVFITLGFHPGMFELDMKTLNLREINSGPREARVLSRIYHVAEPWPPTK